MGAKTNWWHNIGEEVDTSSLVVGGAAVHPTHKLAHFGNAVHRLVFCADCAGTTTCVSSPLLAAVCKNNASETGQRHVHRMLVKGLWPTGEQQASRVRAEVSSHIGFRPTSALRCRIVAAHQSGVHDYVEAIPPEAGEEVKDTFEEASAVAGESNAE